MERVIGKNRKKKNVVVLNLFLLVVILVIYGAIHYKRTDKIDCSFGSIPTPLITFIKNYYPACVHSIKAVMVFNEIPSMKDIEMLNTFGKKFPGQVDFIAIFLKKFKIVGELSFTHRFFSNTELICLRDELVFGKNFFVFLKDNKSVYLDIIPNSQIVTLLLNKNLDSNVRLESKKKEVWRNGIAKRL